MEIYILDQEMNILGAVGMYEAIIWTIRYSKPGRFKMSFAFSSKLNGLLQRGNLIYKTDETEAGYITGRTLTLNKHGEEIIVISGRMMSGYLGKRIIWGKMILNGSTEQVMRTMVERQCINCSDPRRVIPRLILGELKGYSGRISKQVSYENLQETLTEVAGKEELGYRVLLDIDRKKLIFDIYRAWIGLRSLPNHVYFPEISIIFLRRNMMRMTVIIKMSVLLEEQGKIQTERWLRWETRQGWTEMKYSAMQHH